MPIEIDAHEVFAQRRELVIMTLHGTIGAKSAVGLVLVLLFFCPNLSAKTLAVGPAHTLKAPSDAANVASPGDVIEIDPGEYFDCAVWSASGITIEGRGTGTIITDKTCEGKALFVTRGNDITIRNLTFSRARVPDANGAGIRAEGKNLTIEGSRFIDNENGILAGNSPESRISISSSEFVRNGKCAPDCSHGIYVGHIALLRVVGSKFLETKQGHHIKSRALRTELIGNDIRDGKDGTASYLVEIPNGGSLVMDGNVLQKGPNSENRTAAIMIGAEGVTQPTRELSLVNNNFTNDGVQTLFVKNLTATEAVLSANTFKGKVIPLSGDGVVH